LPARDLANFARSREAFSSPRIDASAALMAAGRLSSLMASAAAKKASDKFFVPRGARVAVAVAVVAGIVHVSFRLRANLTQGPNIQLVIRMVTTRYWSKAADGVELQQAQYVGALNSDNQVGSRWLGPLA
jgi:hypothetical protein